MLGEYDLNPAGGAARPGHAADEHDGAVDRAPPRAAAARRRAARARCACAARSSRRSSTWSTTGCGVEEAIDAPRVAPRGAAPPLRGRGATRPSSTRSRRAATTSSAGAAATSTSAASAAVEVGAGGHARRGRRPAPRRARDRGRVRRRAPSDLPAGRRRRARRARRGGRLRAGGLADLGEPLALGRRRAPLPQGGAQPPRRRRVRRRDGRRDRRPPLDLARPAPGEPPRRRPRPDGRRDGAAPGRRARPPRAGGRVGARVRRPQARAPRLPAQRAGDPAVRVVRLRPGGLPQAALPAGQRVRRRDPDGVRDPR